MWATDVSMSVWPAPVSGTTLWKKPSGMGESLLAMPAPAGHQAYPPPAPDNTGVRRAPPASSRRRSVRVSWASAVTSTPRPAQRHPPPPPLPPGRRISLRTRFGKFRKGNASAGPGRLVGPIRIDGQQRPGGPVPGQHRGAQACRVGPADVECVPQRRPPAPATVRVDVQPGAAGSAPLAVPAEQYLVPQHQRGV